MLFAEQQRAQMQLDLEKQDAIEREDKKEIDQLVQKQKTVLSATTVEPKVFLDIHFAFYQYFLSI
jgi:hypothetical protein